MAQKILLIDWDFFSTDVKSWNGFPVHIPLVKEWLDTGKYESEEEALYGSMRESGVFFSSPGNSPIRWLIRILRWFYFKQQDYLGVDGHQPELEKTYNLNPELIEYLYNEYYQFFEGHYVFKVNDQIQRLIDRKPDDWVLGVVSTDRTKQEIELILSDQFTSKKEYSEAFTYRFCTDSPIRIYESAATPEGIEIVSKEIDSFESDSEIYILSNAAYKDQIHSNSIDVVEVWGDKTIDDFKFDNPGQVLVVPNNNETPENVKNERILPDIKNILQVYNDSRTSFDKDHAAIKNLGNSDIKPIHVMLMIFMLIVVVMTGGGVADYLERFYEAQSGHWLSIIGIMLLSAGFCSFIPILVYSVAEAKGNKIESAIFIGFIGGILVPIFTGFERMGLGLSGVFAMSAFMSFYYVREYNKDTKERLKKYENSKHID
jgi:hypothetical protein